jgi:hypothetical protein
MHPYIPHLLEDIAAGYQFEQPRSLPDQSFLDILEEIRKRVEEPGHSLGYYCGLSAENFPPCDQLLKKEMKLISSAVKKMMLSWNLKCDLPRKFPPELIYTFLIKTLEKRIDPEFGSLKVVNYCSMNPAVCLLKEYCTCKNIKPSGDSGFMKFEVQ